MSKENRKCNGTIITVVILALGVAAGYGARLYQVDALEAKAESAFQKAASNENQIIEIKTTLGFILEGQKEQKTLLQEIQKNLKGN